MSAVEPPRSESVSMVFILSQCAYCGKSSQSVVKNQDILQLSIDSWRLMVIFVAVLISNRAGTTSLTAGILGVPSTAL